MRRALEVLMYLAFSIAALPFAWFGLSDLAYYRAHPEMLEVRDSAPEVLGALAGTPFMISGLVIAGVIALYFFVKGPRVARIGSATLIITWLCVFAFTPTTPFRSFARLYWDALPFVVLTALPLVFAAVRVSMRSKNMSAVKT